MFSLAGCSGTVADSSCAWTSCDQSSPLQPSRVIGEGCVGDACAEDESSFGGHSSNAPNAEDNSFSPIYNEGIEEPYTAPSGASEEDLGPDLVDVSVNACSAASSDLEPTMGTGAAKSWANLQQTPFNGTLQISFMARPNASNIDGVLAVSSSELTAFDNAAVAVRFNTDGFVDVRNGAGYDSEVSYPYDANTWYSIGVAVDVAAGTYDVWIAGCDQPDAAETLLLEDASFRAGASAPQLANMALWSAETDQLEIAELSWTGSDGDQSVLQATPSGDPAPPDEIPSLQEGMVSRIQQYGITWVFDREVTAGRFVTGDWWVVGPVTITDIQPRPTGTRNGTMLNPLGGHQAYDSRGSAFDQTAQLRSFPTTIQPNTSVVSSISKGGGTDWKEFKNVGVLQTQAVLTVLDRAPAEGSFRPAYAGSYKKIFNANDIRWEALPKLSPVNPMPSGAEILRWYKMPRIDHLTDWGIQYSCAQDNWSDCYGRELSDQVAEAALYVLLDTPDRGELARGLIQRGIDNYGVLKAGGGYPLDMQNPGGHFSGRKFPVVFAALMLRDGEMMSFDSEFSDSAYFQEDLQTYFGADGTPLWGSECTSDYTATCSGSGAKDCRDPSGSADGCPSYRVCCTSGSWVGQALAVRLMKAEDVWHHDAFFAYVDRWIAEEADNDSIRAFGAQKYGSLDFRREMWLKYR